MIAAALALALRHAPLRPPVAPPLHRAAASADTVATGWTWASYFGTASFGVLARQSGQSWTGGDHPWAFSSPGIDTPIGPQAGTVFQDPATATLPNGCTYQPTGYVNGGPRVYCPRTGSLNFTGWDFSLHGCVPLVIANPSAYAVIFIANSQFIGGPNCAVTNGSLINISAASGVYVTIKLANDLIDEQYVPGSLGPQFEADVFTNTSGPLTVTNTAILNGSGRPLAGTTLGPIIISNDAFYGGCGASLNPLVGVHCEDIELGNGTVGANYNLTYTYNSQIIPSSSNAVWTAPFYANGANGKSQTITFNASNNIVVANASQAGYLGNFYTTSSAMVEFSYAASVTATVANNWIDPTGAQLGCIVTLTTPVTGTPAGNVSLVTGAPVSGIGTGAPATCPPLF